GTAPLTGEGVSVTPVTFTEVQTVQGGTKPVTVSAVTSQVGSVPVTVGVATTAGPIDEQQTLTSSVDPTAGTYKLNFRGNATGAIAWNADATAVQTALRLVAGLGTVTVTGGPLASASFVVTFHDMGNVPLLTVSNGTSMTGVVNEVQTLTPGIHATAGQFKVTYGGNSTADIAFGANAGTVQTALRLVEGLSAVTVTSDGTFATGDVFSVTFPVMGDVALLNVIDGTTPMTGAGSAGVVVTEAEGLKGALVNEAQTLTPSGIATAGAFQINYGGNATADIPYNTSAANVQIALRLVAGLGAVTVTSPGTFATGDAYTVTFPGKGDVAMLTVTDGATALEDTDANPVTVSVAEAIQTDGVKEVQTLTASALATGGQFKIDYGGVKTGLIAYSATAATVQTALRLVAGLETATVTGGRFDTGGAFVVTFPAIGNVAPLVVVSSTDDPMLRTGVPVTFTVAETIDGGNNPVTVAVTTTAGNLLALTATSTVTITNSISTAATGAITFVAKPVSGDRITLNDGAGNIRTYQAVSGAPNRAAGQFQVKSTAALTMTDLMTTINNATPVLGITASAVVQVAETQTLTASIAPTAGQFKIGYGGNLTANIAWDADHAAVQTALRLVAGLGAVTVTGEGLATEPFVVTFPGSGDVALLTVVNGTTALTGAASAAVTVTAAETTKGVVTNELQTLTPSITATAGEFKLNYGGNATANIAFDANAAAVQAALRLVAGLGTVTVTGGGFDTGAAFVVTFPQMGDVALLTITDGDIPLTGAASAAVTVTAAETRKGVAANAAKCILTNDVAGLAGNQAVSVSTFAAGRIVGTALTGGNSTNVVAGDLITLDDGTNPTVTFTFGTGAGKVAVGINKEASAANLANAINNATLLAITAVDNGDGTITLTQDAAGREGNTSVVENSNAITATAFAGALDGTTLSDGDTLTVDDGVNPAVVFTAREGTASGAHEFVIGGSSVRAMANAVAAINAANIAGDVSISAADNFDGSASLTNDNTGISGNQTVLTSGDNFAGSGMDSGLGASIDALSYTATLGAGTNYAGLSAGGSGQSYIWNDVSITGGANGDTVSFYGVYVGGNVTLALAASTDDGDVVTMQDDGAYSVYIGGNLGITQTTGLSTITLRDTLETMKVGGNVTINVGDVAAGTAVTTLRNVAVDGQLLYTGGTGDDDLELVNTVAVGDLATIVMGAGAGSNTLHVTSPETQTFTPSGSPDAGTWTLTYGELESASLDFDADAADVQAALRDLDGLGTVTVTGGGFDAGLSFVVTFPDALGEVPALTFTATDLLEGVDPVTVNVVKEITGFSVGAATGGGLSYTGGSGADTVEVGGASTHNGAATFAMGAGSNALTIRAGAVDGAFSYTGGADADAIDLGYSSFLVRGAFSASPGTGVNTLNLDNASVNGFTYTGGLLGDDLDIGATAFTSTANFAVTGGGGTDSLTMDNATIVGTVTYTGGAGDDTVDIGADSFNARGTVAIVTGTGTNDVTLNGRSRTVTFTGSTGADTLTAGDKDGSGGYIIDGDLAFIAGGGNDRLDFDGTLRKLTYTGLATGTGTDTFNLGAGGESVFDALSDVTINAGGVTALLSTVGTNIAVNTGTIKNANIRGNFLYNGSNGVDTLNIGQGAGTGMIVAKTVTMNLYGGGDTVNIDDSKFGQSSGTFAINTGAGGDTIGLDVDAASSTTFYRKATFTNASAVGGVVGGGIDTFNDRAVVGSAGTRYLAPTLATRPVFTAFWSSSSVINGDDSNG
ncbi:MAG: hypothetical protein WCK05_05775, partial [Planctomycetota bacterium]